MTTSNPGWSSIAEAVFDCIWAEVERGLKPDGLRGSSDGRWLSGAPIILVSDSTEGAADVCRPRDEDGENEPVGWKYGIIPFCSDTECSGIEKEDRMGFWR